MGSSMNTDSRDEDPQQSANGLPARVADAVGEVSRSAEKPSRGRPLSTVARNALARVNRRNRPATDSRPDVPSRPNPLARVGRRGAQAAGRGVRLGGQWMAGQVLAMAPRLPVRDQATLREQFPGKSPEEVADALIDGASRGAAAVGATVGVWSVLPIAPAFPAEIATETLTLVGIELKLIAELHEVYGVRPKGDFPSRMIAYVGAWAHRRGVTLAPSGVVLAIGSPVGRQLQRRLAARAGRSAVSLGPLLTGAAAGALINRRETRRLGHDVREDLRKRSPIATHWPE
jgi:hypothetical protein